MKQVIWYAEKELVMNTLLQDFEQRLGPVRDIYSDSLKLLSTYQKHETAVHVTSVARKAVELSRTYKLDEQKAEIAGILHDISTVFPNESRVEISEYLGIALFEEEKRFPMIIHQKLSKEIACRYFAVVDPEILDAIGCHTTLRANPTKLDMAIFLADKIDWDQKGQPPYLREIETGLTHSLEQGAFNFLQYLIENKATLKVLHPWLVQAFDFFKAKNYVA